MEYWEAMTSSLQEAKNSKAIHDNSTNTVSDG